MGTFSREQWGRRATRAGSGLRGLGGPVIGFFLLLAVAAVWGSSYPLTKVLLEDMTARQYLAIRFALAALALAIAFPGAVRRLSPRRLLQAAGLGVLYSIAQLLQTIGLEYTPATISGFITGLYVVFTPLCAALLLRTMIDRRVWIGSVLAVIGLAALALQDFSLGLGEWLTLCSALFFALHILGLGRWSVAKDALGMAVVQMIVLAVVSAITSIPDGFAAPSHVGGWLILVYLAVVSGGLAMMAQTWAQSQLSAGRAAIIMSTEPVWSALLAISVFTEPLNWRVIVGGGLMLAAMLVVEVPARGPRDPAGPEDLPKLAG